MAGVNLGRHGTHTNECRPIVNLGGLIVTFHTVLFIKFITIAERLKKMTVIVLKAEIGVSASI